MLVDGLTELSFDRFQGSVFERGTSQLWEMVGFRFGLLTVMIDGRHTLSAMPCAEVRRRLATHGSSDRHAQ